MSTRIFIDRPVCLSYSRLGAWRGGESARTFGVDIRLQVNRQVSVYAVRTACPELSKGEI